MAHTSSHCLLILNTKNKSKISSFTIIGCNSLIKDAVKLGNIHDMKKKYKREIKC